MHLSPESWNVSRDFHYHLLQYCIRGETVLNIIDFLLLLFFRFFFLSGVSSVTNNAFYSSELILELQSVASLVSSFFLFYSIKKDHWKRCIGLKDFVVSRLILRVIPYIRPVPEVREGVVWLRTPSCLSMYVCVCACVVSVFLCVRIWTPIPRAESPRTGLARAWA